jgi:hypothetical protein
MMFLRGWWHMNMAETAKQSVHDPKRREFISYSRVDGVFAEKLRVALIARGFEAYLDTADMLAGEPWRARLDSIILAATTLGISIFLFIVARSAFLASVSLAPSASRAAAS